MCVCASVCVTCTPCSRQVQEIRQEIGRITFLSLTLLICWCVVYMCMSVCVCACVTCTFCSCQVQVIFGPVLVVYVYLEKEWESTLRLINDTSLYGLTGSVFACNRDIVRKSMDIL